MTARAMLPTRVYACLLCGCKLAPGAGLWVTIGPGPNAENRRRFREGLPYEPRMLAVAACRGCAFGIEDDETTTETEAVPRAGQPA